MADLDTRSKRNSGIHVGFGWMRPLPLPDNSVDTVDRQHIPGFYSGVTAATPDLAGGGMNNAFIWDWQEQ